MPISNPISPVQNAIVMPFSWGDASPKPIATVAAGATIFTAQIVIIVPFNGVDCALQLGTLEDPDRLIAANQNDPTFAAEYETNPGLLFFGSTDLYLTITPGSGCTQGNGFILIEV